MFYYPKLSPYNLFFGFQSKSLFSYTTLSKPTLLPNSFSASQPINPSVQLSNNIPSIQPVFHQLKLSPGSWVFGFWSSSVSFTPCSFLAFQLIHLNAPLHNNIPLIQIKHPSHFISQNQASMVWFLVFHPKPPPSHVTCSLHPHLTTLPAPLHST